MLSSPEETLPEVVTRAATGMRLAQLDAPPSSCCEQSGLAYTVVQRLASLVQRLTEIWADCAFPRGLLPTPYRKPSSLYIAGCLS